MLQAIDDDRADTRSNSELARFYGVSKPANVRLHKTWRTNQGSEATRSPGPLKKANPDIPSVFPGTVDHGNTGVTATGGSR
jgi:hypothetical protein